MAKTVVPVADLRRSPVELTCKNFDHNNLRESQLLFNEEVDILETKGEWARVAAVEQLIFSSERGWHPYEGWVRLEEIGEGKIPKKFVVCEPGIYSYGTYVETFLPGSRPIPQNFDRRQMVKEARRFLGAPYLWGGRSSYFSDPVASIDCSGLINLLYRAQGIAIPRNAHDQFLFGKAIESLRPGDPLFLAKEQRVNHVILKLEDYLFIEAPETGRAVRLLKLGKEIREENGRWHIFDRPHSYKGYCVSIAKTD
ncbi:MAG: C40 family peptidase [Chlamydiales bacterium]|nr:C40 family peptidase [Chlamydiales bacterium]